MELGPEDMSLLERCPYFRGCWLKMSNFRGCEATPTCTLIWSGETNPLLGNNGSRPMIGDSLCRDGGITSPTKQEETTLVNGEIAIAIVGGNTGTAEGDGCYSIAVFGHF